MRNASVPTQTILPHVAYEDVAQGIEWLSEVLGFVEHYRYGDPDDPQGAQVYLGDAWLMLEKARPGKSSPNALRGMTQYLSLFVDDVDAYYEKANRAGATVIEDVNDTIYVGFTAGYAVHREYGANGQAPDAFVRSAAQQWQGIVNQKASELKRRLGH